MLDIKDLDRGFAMMVSLSEAEYSGMLLENNQLKLDVVFDLKTPGFKSIKGSIGDLLTASKLSDGEKLVRCQEVFRDALLRHEMQESTSIHQQQKGSAQ